METVSLNPFFSIDLGPPIRCTLLLEGRTFQLSSAAHVRFLAEFNGTRSREDAIALASGVLHSNREAATGFIESLVTNGLLVAERNSALDESMNHWVSRGWLDALALHCETRSVRFAEEDGRRAEALGELATEGAPPPFWSTRIGQRLSLPQAESLPTTAVGDVMLRRRSHQRWAASTMDDSRLATLVAHVNEVGLRLRRNAEARWMDEPATLLNSSFVALETYVIANSVRSVRSGFYYYDLAAHALVELSIGPMEEITNSLCSGQRHARGAPCVLLLTAVWRRYMYRYRHPRAYRTLMVNVAELAQRYVFLATSLGLSTFLTPALNDPLAESLLGVPFHEEGALYVIGIG